MQLCVACIGPQELAVILETSQVCVLQGVFESLKVCMLQRLTSVDNGEFLTIRLKKSQKVPWQLPKLCNLVSSFLF